MHELEKPQLQGKVAFITGASRGIGNAIAKRFAAEGASVVLCASRLGVHGKLPGTLEEEVAIINQSGGKAAGFALDLTDEKARATAIEQAAAYFGPIDILVNNAAGAKMLPPSMVTTSQRNWMFDLNVNAPVDLAQQALAHMQKSQSGWILNISSETAHQPRVPYPDTAMSAHVIGAYGSTKAALDRYTEALAHEVAPDNVCINTLAPEAMVLTPGAEQVRSLGEKRPDMVEPVEMMAEAALELCSRHHVGQICYSRRLLHRVNRPLFALDGVTIIGDAFTPGLV